MTRPLAQTARMLDAAMADPWARGYTDDATVEPFKAGWNGDPVTWRLHYRVRPVDWGCIERIEAFRDLRRAEMGEARWSQLMAEWNA